MNFFTTIGQFFANWGTKLAATFLEDDRYMMLVEGLRNTVIITLGALCIGVVIGSLVAVTKYCGEGSRLLKPLCTLCDIYTTVIRGVPVVVLLLIFYFVIMKSASGVSGGIAVGIVTFGINSGAYMAELMRSGIGAVDAWQMEAGRSLGLSRIQTTIHVILPQAIRVSLLPMTNDFIALLKDSSLVSIITLVDLTRTYGQLATVNYDYFGTGFIVAVIYLLIGTPFVRIARKLEKKLNVSLRGRRVFAVHRAANYNE